MGLGLEPHTELGKSESIERWTNTPFVLVFSWDLLSKKNTE